MLNWLAIELALAVVMLSAAIFLDTATEVAVVVVAFVIASALNAIALQPWGEL